MALEVGSRLGVFEVTGRLGEGGMGVVYRATDTTLDRDVALKVLPDAFAQDEERLARFEREAKVLASLNHPNIAAIHGLEQSGDTRALVLELVEGPTLQDRIAKGPIPLDEALPIARQIAEALEAAHEQGVIHRDLKPANVKVKDDGTVKVLDFGLAKALAPDLSDTEAANSPTMTMTAAATKMGVIMGTAAYMSPEQAKGRQVDKRADIWAFGVVLYEMLTGRQAFGGTDISETLAAVLMREIDMTALPTKTPASVRRMLRRCVTRDRKNRLADMSMARLEIDEADTAPEASAGEATAPVAQLALWQRPAPLALGVFAIAFLAASMVWILKSTPTEPPPVTRFAISVEPNFTQVGSRLVTISPDGMFVAYAAGGQLFLRNRDRLETAPVSGIENPAGPFFSPDSRWVGFFDPADQRLKRVAVSGGGAVTIGEATRPIGASWEADDTILFGQGSEGIWRVLGTGGTPERLISVEDGEQAGFPKLLPDGDTVIFTLDRSGAWLDPQIVAESISTGERRVLLEPGLAARYLPTGHLIYTLSTGLLAVPFDIERLEVQGGPVPVLEGFQIGGGGGGGFAPHLAVSDSGHLVYVGGSLGAFGVRRLVWVSRNNQVSAISDSQDEYLVPRLSPDGRRLAVGIGSASPDGDLWVYDLDRLTRTRLTVDGGNHPLWTVDGGSVVFSSAGLGGDLYRMAADGSDQPELLLSREGRQVPVSWSPGGDLLAFVESPNNQSWDIQTLAPDGDVQPFLVTSFNENSPSFSPDRRWMAYASDASDESGDLEVYVQSFPEPGSKIAISSGGGWSPTWAANEIVYAAPGGVMAVAVRTDPTLTVEAPRQVLSGAFAGINDFSFDPHYAVSFDGERFVMMTDDALGESERREIVVVLNWFAELQARVPTGP